MAKARKKAASAPARRPAAGDSSAKSSRAPRAAVDVVEEEKGLGLEDALVYFTFIVLIVAFPFLDHMRGSYGQGLFFKN
ncbi:MAG: hypothetical protein R3E96_10405 [Planctomycetota bacterium]